MYNLTQSGATELQDVVEALCAYVQVGIYIAPDYA